MADEVVNEPDAAPVTEPLATLDEESVTFQRMVADVADGTIGTVERAGTIYDVEYSGDAGTLEVINKGQDDKGSTALATVTMADSLDGVQRRVELTSVLADRVVAEGDVLAVKAGRSGKGGDSGKIRVTIQRNA